MKKYDISARRVSNARWKKQPSFASIIASAGSDAGAAAVAAPSPLLFGLCGFLCCLLARVSLALGQHFHFLAGSTQSGLRGTNGFQA